MDADLYYHLDLLVHAKEIDRLAELVARSSDEAIEAISHHVTAETAKKLEKNHPTQAARLWRAQAMWILNQKKSRYYDAALQNLERARRCYGKAGMADGWQSVEPGQGMVGHAPLRRRLEAAREGAERLLTEVAKLRQEEAVCKEILRPKGSGDYRRGRRRLGPEGRGPQEGSCQGPRLDGAKLDLGDAADRGPSAWVRREPAVPSQPSSPHPSQEDGGPLLAAGKVQHDLLPRKVRAVITRFPWSEVARMRPLADRHWEAPSTGKERGGSVPAVVIVAGGRAAAKVISRVAEAGPIGVVVVGNGAWASLYLVCERATFSLIRRG